MNDVRRTVRRVHITGGQGSGKTTLARRIGARLGVPVYDLDSVWWDARTGAERSLDERLALAQRLAAQPGWVTEVTPLGWTDPLFRVADLIVWMDVPWRVAVWRMVGRHIRAGLAGNNRHPGLRKLAQFIWYTKGYYRSDAPPLPVPADGEGQATRAETAYRLAAYPDKAVHCRGTGDLRALFARLD
ncbi:MAG: hypothetical protein ACRDJE_00135 [Dehalococcoidia bacterium]